MNDLQSTNGHLFKYLEKINQVSQDSYQKEFNYFLRFVNENGFTNLDTAINRYIEHLENKNISANTFNIQIASIKNRLFLKIPKRNL